MYTREKHLATRRFFLVLFGPFSRRSDKNDINLIRRKSIILVLADNQNFSINRSIIAVDNLRNRYVFLSGLLSNGWFGVFDDTGHEYGGVLPELSMTDQKLINKLSILSIFARLRRKLAHGGF